MGKVTPAHNQIRTLVEIAHYEAHPDQADQRKEFEKVKDYIHKQKRRCFIDNGRCEGQLDVHHALIELSMANGIDWGKVKTDFPAIENANDYDQMMVLCDKHHKHRYFGVHNQTYNNWIAQKYMNEEALNAFEEAVKVLEETGHVD